MKGSFVLGTYDKGTQSGQNWYIEDKSKGSSLRVTPPPLPLFPDKTLHVFNAPYPPRTPSRMHSALQQRRSRGESGGIINLETIACGYHLDLCVSRMNLKLFPAYKLILPHGQALNILSSPY